MFVRKLLATACVVALPNISSSATVEVDLEVGGGWSVFRFAEGFREGAWIDNRKVTDEEKELGVSLDALSFEFTLRQHAILQVTDAYLIGDQFEVFNNGVSLGLTSAPKTPPDINVVIDYTDDDAVEALQRELDDVQQIDSDWDAAFADDSWSSASFFLTPGTYSITGTVVNQPLLYGRGAVQLVAPVPVPASVMFMLTALGGGFAFSRFRNRKSDGVV
ncbi:MAG: hypothetical protein ABJX32_06415 [Tateyamaria sp.]|uniref:hypothetical protein n=1 Tax=Tateyamaria sp. TaxID=1929288 RepID=UPI0032A13695